MPDEFVPIPGLKKQGLALKEFRPPKGKHTQGRWLCPHCLQYFKGSAIKAHREGPCPKKISADKKADPNKVRR
jgi:hypothetical protein